MFVFGKLFHYVTGMKLVNIYWPEGHSVKTQITEWENSISVARGGVGMVGEQKQIQQFVIFKSTSWCPYP